MEARATVNEKAKGTWLEDYINYDFPIDRTTDTKAYFTMYDDNHKAKQYCVNKKVFNF